MEKYINGILIDIMWSEDVPNEETRINNEIINLIIYYFDTFKNLPPIGLRLRTSEEFCSEHAKCNAGCYIDTIAFGCDYITFWLTL